LSTTIHSFGRRPTAWCDHWAIAPTFASAADFLRSSDINEANCLICDVQMPGLSRVDLQRVLIAQGHRMPMIFITAYFDERNCQRVMEAGAIGYLGQAIRRRESD
jgi:FixJ family two-component response regulator